MATVRTMAAALGVVGIAWLAGCDMTVDKVDLPKPEGWDKAPAGDARVKYVSPAEGADDDFREYVEVAGAMPPGRTSKVSELAYNDLHKRKRRLDDMKIESEEEVRIAGRACRKVVYTHKDSGRRLKVQAYYFLFHATGMVLTGTATDKSYDRFAPRFERIANTLKFR